MCNRIAVKTGLVLVAFLVTGSATVAGKLGRITSQSEFEDFAHTYYLNPKPELVADAILFMDKLKLLERENAQPPFLAFFALVFQKNQGSVSEWEETIRSTNGKAKKVLLEAMSMAKQEDPIMKIQEHSPSVNDMYWGAFFATGDDRYLGKLVDELRYVDERDSLELFGTGASAKWSLASNALLHEKVRSYLQNIVSTSQGRIRDFVKDLLESGPVKVRSEIAEIVRSQREKGKW